MSRVHYYKITLFSSIAMLTICILPPSPRLLWNASASVPTGLYLLAGTDQLKRGDLVAAQPPQALSRYMAVRFYLPLGLPLIKHVGALPGDTVCRSGDSITINGRAIAAARATDHLKRSLPVWQGCRHIAPGEIFLLNPDVPDSFDGRYFGVLPMRTLLGRTLPLWTSAPEPSL